MELQKPRFDWRMTLEILLACAICFGLEHRFWSEDAPSMLFPILAATLTFTRVVEWWIKLVVYDWISNQHNNSH